MPHCGATLVVAIIGLLSTCGLHAESCRVDHCHDGDTCTLECAGERVKVRLYCIDAPELLQAPWGEQSRDHLRGRIPPAASVDLVSVTRDKYGRTVGVLLFDGMNVNLNQVQSGWAAAYPKYCADPVYYQAQADAQAQRRGIWQVEGEQQRPWDWRGRNR